MTTVREILEQSGIDTYTINSLDANVTGALQNVLTKAEQDKMSVQEFWTNTYNPGIQAWENERGDLARKLARAEAEKAALERERQVLAEQGIATDSVATLRTDRGQFTQTPGTPTFSDPNEFVSRATQGLAAIADVDWKHRTLFGTPMPLSPSQLIAEADAKGVSPVQYAEQRFGFAKKQQEDHDNQIRQETETRLRKQFSEASGPNPDISRPQGSARFSDIRRAVRTGERPDPTKMTPEQRRAEVLKNIHRAVEERQERDA